MCHADGIFVPYRVGGNRGTGQQAGNYRSSCRARWPRPNASDADDMEAKCIAVGEPPVWLLALYQSIMLLSRGTDISAQVRPQGRQIWT